MTELKHGDTVRLTGISRHGKNRIHEEGAKWIVVKRGMLNAPSKQGDAWLLDNDKNDPDGYGLQWVLVDKDPDFKMELWEEK